MSRSGAIQASGAYDPVNSRIAWGSRNSRSTTCSGILKNTGIYRGSPIAVDGRARVIRLTAKGRRLEETIYAAAGAAQLQIEEILGPRRFAQLHSSLELLTKQLEGSPAIP